jgi:ADP-heptose:LPS heptosyltransferase/GT2 family glycosyltransferase
MDDLELPSINQDHMSTREVVHCDIAHITKTKNNSDGTIGVAYGQVSGWAVGSEPISRIDILLANDLIGIAKVGLVREDVAQLFPHLPHAGTSGFEASLTDGVLESEQPEIVLRFRTLSGRNFFVRKNLIIHKDANNLAIAPVRIAVDHCIVDHSNRLFVSGWAVSMAKIVAMQFYIGEERVGTTIPDKPRPDVASAFENYPNNERSGFQFVRPLTTGQRLSIDAVRVEAIAADGQVRSQTVPVRFDGSIGAEQSGIASKPSSNLTGISATVISTHNHDTDIHFCCDHVSLDTQGSFHASGWAVAQAGISQISVVVGHQLAGDAQIKMSRPDVQKALPQMREAGLSGFSITTVLAIPVAGELGVRFELYLADGTRRIFETTVTALPPLEFQAASPGTDEIMMSVDGMQISDGHSHRAITGPFQLAGWAIARAEVDHVEAFIDGQLVGRAYIGIRREDVHAAFPTFPNSLYAGYALWIPNRSLKSGRAQFRVVTTARDGAQSDFSFTVDIDRSEAGSVAQVLRRRITAAEAQTGLAILQARGPLPVCDIAVRVRENGNLQALTASLSSLTSQSYPHWRAWLFSTDDRDLRSVSWELVKANPQLTDRIGVIEDYAAPKGNFLAGIWSAGDIIAADGLLSLALNFNDLSDKEIVYGDDRRQQTGSRSISPFFKPDWSPDLLLSQNYIGRAWLVSANLLSEAGMSLPELAYMGEYDALLRLTEITPHIHHVAKLVMQLVNDRTATTGERQALTRAVHRRGIKGRVERGRHPSLHRIRRENRSGKVTIIIPSIGAKGHVIACVNSIRNLTKGVEYEIIIVDNIRKRGLTDDGRKWKSWFRKNADIVVAVDEPFNWSRLNNLGAEAASGEFLLFLNDDIEIHEPDWLNILLTEADRPEVGIVGAQLLYGDGRVQHAGMFLSSANAGSARHAFRFAESDDPGYFGLALSQREVSCITGACMMIRRALFERVGKFDEIHSVVNNDIDFCLRVTQFGKSVIYTPYVSLTHHELASRAQIKDVYDKSIFLSTWGDKWSKGDPYYNVNLSGEVDDYAIEEEPLREVYAGHPIGNRDDIHRILVVKLDHIGDVVTSLPAFRRLKSHFPKSEITALIAHSSAGIARLESAIDKIINFDFFDARSGLGIKKLKQRDYDDLELILRDRHFDLAIDFRKHADTRHILKLCGAPIVAGYDDALKFPWLDVALQWERDPLLNNKRSHVTDDLINLVDAVSNAFIDDRRNIIPSSGLPALSDPIASEFADLLTSKYVVVHPAAGTGLRQWSPLNFARLIDLLANNDSMRIALIGGPDEREIAEKVINATERRDAVFNLVGRSRLSDVPEILARSVLFVGNNSGPSHIASGLGVPTVAVHSAVVASEEWGPLGPQSVALRRDMNCSPCYIADVKQCHRDLACLKGLSPHAVYALCKRFLSLRAVV